MRQQARGCTLGSGYEAGMKPEVRSSTCKGYEAGMTQTAASAPAPEVGLTWSAAVAFRRCLRLLGEGEIDAGLEEEDEEIRVRSIGVFFFAQIYIHMK